MKSKKSPSSRNTYRETLPTKKNAKPVHSANVRRIQEKKAEKKQRNPIKIHPIHINTIYISRILKVFTFFLSLAIILFGCWYACAISYNYCTTNPYFSLSDISVEGTQRLSKEEILHAAGIEVGMNSLSINVNSTLENILTNPWIEQASIKRKLPRSIHIKVKERIPQFFARKKNKMYYVNDKGELIAPVDSLKKFTPLPILELGQGGEDFLSLTSEFLHEFDRANFPFKISQISWIKVSAGGGFEVYWEKRALTLSFGRENWQDNLQKMATVLNDIELRKETSFVKSIKAADGQVWMVKK